MKLIITLALSILLFANAPSIQAKDVSFASFNVYWLFDDKEPQLKWFNEIRHKNGQTYQESITLVANKIKQINADVIALQEIEDDGVLRDLQDKLNALGLTYNYRFSCQCKDSFTGQDVAILSKYPAVGDVIYQFNERKTYLTEEDRFNEKDTSLSKAMMVPLLIENETINTFVFHLKSQSGGYKSDKQRQAQASLVRRVTLPYLQDKKNVMVMGDLNAEPGTKSLYKIRGFDDIYANLYQSTNHEKFKGNKTTYIYKGRNQQIDHILVNRNLYKRFLHGEMFADHSKNVSDHNAIKITLSGF